MSRRINGVMEHYDDSRELPLVDDPAVKNVFAEFCTGLNFVHGNLHMTFAAVTADHSANRAPSKGIVSARIVMPIIGAIELRDLLTQLIDTLTEQGVIIPETSLSTIVTPPGEAPLKSAGTVRRQSKLSVTRRGLMTPDAV